MKTDEQLEEFDQKCRAAGCSPEKAKLHAKLFRERWDVHPPADFIKWLHDFHPNASNHVSAWNSDSCRQEYYEWIGHGEPKPPAVEPFNMAEHMASFRASMAKIESRCSRGPKVPVAEDTRLKGYDKR